MFKDNNRPYMCVTFHLNTYIAVYFEFCSNFPSYFGVQTYILMKNGGVKLQFWGEVVV